MKEHVEIVVAAVERQIEDLVDLRTLLRAFGGLDVGGTMPAAVAAVAAVVQTRGVGRKGIANSQSPIAKRPIAKRQSPIAKAGKGVRAKKEKRGGGVPAEVAGLGVEFTRQEMVGLVGAGRQPGMMWRWEHKGWVKRVGPGRYRRTALWPGAAVAPATAAPASGGRPKVPGLDAPEGSAEEQLQRALQERDMAVSRGQETLARILQDKVDGLQRKLGQ